MSGHVDSWSWGDSVRYKAKRRGFKIRISACRRTMCPIAGNLHVAIGGHGVYRNNLSLADADAFLAEWDRQQAEAVTA